MRSLSGSSFREALLDTDRKRAELLEESFRCRFRVINLPGERGQLRRDHIKATCLDLLSATYPSLDAGFTDGVIARELPWSEQVAQRDLQRHKMHATRLGGQRYVADEEFWDGPTRNEAEHMMKDFVDMGWHAGLWPAFLQDCSEPNSWGYVGCQLAHVEAWREAHAVGAEWLLLCEDDVCPAPLPGVDWPATFALVASEIQALRARGERWDLLFVGKGSSVSPEGRQITPLIVECGYNIKMHCYCISREGMAKLLESQLPYQVIRPQDEVLAALNVQGNHPRRRLREKILELCPAASTFRSLCFPWWGIVFQMQHFERHRNSELCKSAIGELGALGM